MTEQWADADLHERAMVKTPPSSRKRCSCCGRRATHVGTANGMAMMGGCDLRVRRWVKQGSIAIQRSSARFTYSPEMATEMHSIADELKAAERLKWLQDKTRFTH